MATLLNKLGSKIKGVLEGFDRFVFKGMLKPLCYPGGMQSHLGRNNVLNKNYSNWVNEKSATIVSDAEAYTSRMVQSPILYLPTSNIRKEALAHEQQRKNSITSGLIGTWSCVEACMTYKAVYDKAAGYPQLKWQSSRCKHLYFYYDHSDYGFMSIRLQTWAPYEIQIALNGREWLKRSLEKANCGYLSSGNKFLDIENFDLAQKHLSSQVETQWIDMLSSFLYDVFPSMQSLLGEEMSYTWTLWQSEWARDYIFNDQRDLDEYMNPLLRHAFITGNGERVLRYFGCPVRTDGQPHQSATPEIMTRLNQWYDGARIRHWIDKNSLKLYNERNVLRFEFTMNDPTRFRVHRTVEGKESQEKKLLPMRKGVADVRIRTQVCSSRINNFTEHVATLQADISVEDIISKVSQPLKSRSKRFRALDVTGKDLALLRAIADPKYYVDSITNKHLQSALCDCAWANGLSGKSLSARISRHLHQEQHQYGI